VSIPCYLPQQAEEMQESRVWSREMVAYVSAILPVNQYFKAGDTRIAGICDDKYTMTLEMLNETSDLAFKKYLTRKTQGWFQRFRRDEPAGAAAASPAHAVAGAPAPEAPGRQRRPLSDDEEDGANLMGGPRSTDDT
jgi:hypothetical protein